MFFRKRKQRSSNPAFKDCIDLSFHLYASRPLSLKGSPRKKKPSWKYNSLESLFKGSQMKLLATLSGKFSNQKRELLKSGPNGKDGFIYLFILLRAVSPGTKNREMNPMEEKCQSCKRERKWQSSKNKKSVWGFFLRIHQAVQNLL